jgi:hypothetical protein
MGKEFENFQQPKSNSIFDTLLKEIHNKIPVSRVTAEIDIMSALNLIDQHKRSSSHWTFGDIRDDLLRVNNCEELILRGPAHVIAGKGLILGTNDYQDNVLEIVYDVDLNDYRWNALVESVETEEKIEVKIKHVPLKFEKNNNIIISQGLADHLGIKNYNGIRIIDISLRRQENFNLDTLE